MKIKYFIKNWRKILDKYLPALELMNKSTKVEVLRRFSLVYMLFVFFTMYVIVRVFIITIDQPRYRIAKNIKVDLAKAIYANCTYEDIKIFYDRKERININNYYNVEIYEKTVDLANILEDMIYDYYRVDLKDSSYVSKLRSFLKETNAKYPFDNLTESQKELFISLKNNSGDQYNSIQDNLISISEELNNKNEIVDRYLNKSNQSYILSIIALCLTILQTLPLIKKEVEKWILNKANGSENIHNPS